MLGKYVKPLHEEYGAGEDGSEEASVKYQKDTPGQEKAHMPLRKRKTFKLHHELPEQYGMAGETLPEPSLGENDPSHSKTLHTIKRLLRGKYKKGRSFI
jgi:hypothetical protein